MQLDNSHHAAADVEKAARSVLKDLQQDYIDLFLIHWPLVSGCKGDTLKPPIKAGFAYCREASSLPSSRPAPICLEAFASRCSEGSTGGLISHVEIYISPSAFSNLPCFPCTHLSSACSQGWLTQAHTFRLSSLPKLRLH